MKFKATIIASLVAASMMLSTAQASTIQVVLPVNPGGNISSSIAPVIQQMNSMGWNLDVIMAGNCANANRILSRATSPVIYVWDSSNHQITEASHPCYRTSPLVENFLGILYSVSELFCGRGPIETLQNTESNNLRLGTVEFGQRPETILGIKNKFNFASTVQYRNSGAITRAYQAGEIDYFVSSAGHRLQRDNLATCYMNTSSSDVRGIPSVNSFGISQTYEFIPYISVLNSNNFDIEKFQKDLSRAFASSEVRQVFTERLLESPAPTLDEQYRSLMKLIGD